MLGKEEIIYSLRNYNIKGKPVTVHSSLKAIGEIEGGAETLLLALKERFATDGGLLIIPSHTWDRCELDLREKRTCIGVLPNISVMQKDVTRSHHPTHSVAVFGDKQKAMDFVRGDETVDTPASPEGSYGRLYDEDGYIFLIGVGHEKNTFIHCVEEMFGYPRYLKEKILAKFTDENGNCTKRQLYWFDDEKTGDVSLNFGKFEEAFNYYGCIEYSTLGNAKTQLIRARDIKRIMEIIYKNANGEELLADNNPLDTRLYKF